MTLTYAPAPTLMTSDEARLGLARSALRCLRSATCGPAGLLAMLWGLPAAEDWAMCDRELAEDHLGVLAEIADAGHEGLIGEELAGICSATGLAGGQVDNLEVIAQIVGEGDDAA